jgi:starvation-inducible DNA-binding protein
MKLAFILWINRKNATKDLVMIRKSQMETFSREEIELSAHNLAQILANTYVTYVKTQNFHWNLVDPRFYALHTLFEKLYEELAEAIDELAERIRTLRHASPGSMGEFLQLATLEESSERITGDKMLMELCRDREVISEQLQQKIEETDRDPGTQDLFIQHLRMHDKTAWMLRSHFSHRQE